MEDKHHWGVRTRLRWTLGSLMVVVATSALVIALARPFLKETPPVGEVIGLDFDLVETRSPSGEPIMGLVQKITVIKQASGNTLASKP